MSEPDFNAASTTSVPKPSAAMMRAFGKVVGQRCRAQVVFADQQTIQGNLSSQGLVLARVHAVKPRAHHGHGVPVCVRSAPSQGPFVRRTIHAQRQA